MTKDPMVSCVGQGPTPIVTESGAEAVPQEHRPREEVKMETARVGKKAPDFRATAYFAGAFKQVSLSEYSGKWVLLCFYPGDFTFV
jgi:hypothetical protein